MASSISTSSISTQKRARQQLSCTACRNGKLRCDRQQPCDQCIKRSRDSTCQYLAPPPKKKQSRNTKDRIAHLEGLVVQLMNKDGSAISETSPEEATTGTSNETASANSHSGSNSDPKTSPDSGYESVPDASDLGFGNLQVSHGQMKYKGSTHWESILESIADVKAAMEGDEAEDSEQEEEASEPLPLGLIGQPAIVTREYLLQNIPPKPTTDRLLWQWFNSTDPALPLLHRPTFLAQYEQLWREPAETPTMWLGLLFAMLSLGSRIASFVQQPDPMVPGGAGENGSPDHFQQLSASALELGDYMKSKKFTVEALIMHGSCEYMKRQGDGLKLWLLMAVIVRIALRMGYHRDPDHFPNITPFEGEMRRRVWCVVYVFDVLQSYQQGLPNMLQHLQMDTKPPSNLLDNDFGPDCTGLPTPRPLSELSPVSYSISKFKMTSVFARACNMSHSVELPDYDQIMELDRFVQKTNADLPQALRFTSMYQSILDTPSLIFHRYKGELTFHKTRCVLHRAFMTDKFVGTRMELSRKLCVESAMSMLKHHDYVFHAAQDGGQLSAARMYMASLSAHDFLLAAMVLCVELDLISSAPSPAMAGPNLDKVEEMRRLIETSYNIYKQPGNHFAQTDKAVKAMEVILRKSKPANGPAFSNISFDMSALAPPNELNLQQEIPGSNSVDPALQYTDITNLDRMGPCEPSENLYTTGQDMDWQTWDTIVNNNDYVSSMAWPPELGNTDMSFLDSMTGGAIDPSFSVLDSTVYGTRNEVEAFPTTSAPS